MDDAPWEPHVADGDFDPEQMLRVLEQSGVRFVLIGGMAAVMHGDVGVTVDLDIVPEHSPGNLERLVSCAESSLTSKLNRDAMGSWSRELVSS